jgi:hypothetical protein
MKPQPEPMCVRTKSERGIALVLTLAILTLVTLLVIAFTVSMRVENTASKNFNDLIKARQLAQAAVDQAVSIIRSATPPPSPGMTWVAAPGVIYMISAAGITKSNIYTDASVLGAGTINLNSGGFITGFNSFYNASSMITAGWQNVTAPGGELIGRFAYWMDVEATKLDVNFANRRTAPDPQNPDDPLLNQSIPRDMDLRVLEGPFYRNDTNVDSLWNAHSNPPLQPWFSTLEEIRRGLSPTMSPADFDANKFYCSVSTVDTNVDAFGRDRIDITAITSEIAPAYSNALARLRENYWGRILYPTIVSPTRDTFEEKYGEFGVRQILANIIEYQNPVETSIPVGNTNLDGDALPRDYSGLKKCPMISDVIVHVATNAIYSGTPGLTNLELRVFVDVRLINIYNQDRGNGYQILIEPEFIKYTPTGGVETDITPSEQSKTLSRNVSARSYGLLGAPSTSAQFLGTHPPPVWMATIAGTTPGVVPTLDQVRVRLRRVRLLNTPGNASSVVDWMSPADFAAAYPTDMVFLPARFVPYTKPGTNVTSPDFVSANPSPNFRPMGLHKLDPRVRTFSGTLSRANGGPSFTVNWRPLQDQIDTASPNPSWRASVLGVIRDSLAPTYYGLLADVRSVEPGPFSTPGTGTVSPTMRYLGDYREGPMESLGELTYIHTGYPHRTIRFRSVIPRTSGTSSATPWADAVLASDGSPHGCVNTFLGLQTVEQDAIPDWVLLDIFKVGAASAYSGRLNINTRFSGPAATLKPRTPPIAGLFNNTSVNLSVQFDTTTGTNLLSAIVGPTFGFGIASNVANRVFLPSSPWAALPPERPYFTPGEICEVRDVEYFSDIVHTTVAAYNDAPSKRRRQQAIRRVSNLITVRSNLFTVWAIAQAIKEPNITGQTLGTFQPGIDLITGEVKVQAIIERYEEAGQVKFRTRYYRFIYQ